jgi:hypothetical protein
MSGSDPLTPEAVQALVTAVREALAKATPGPWRVEHESCDCGGGCSCVHGEYPDAIVGPKNATCHDPTTEYSKRYGHAVSEVCEFTDADADLIAHAPSWLAECVALLSAPSPQWISCERCKGLAQWAAGVYRCGCGWSPSAREASPLLEEGEALKADDRALLNGIRKMFAPIPDDRLLAAVERAWCARANEEGFARLADKRLEEAQAVARESNAACTCGCPLSEHENYGEEGMGCSNPMHECQLCSKAVATEVAMLKATVARLERERDALQEACTHENAIARSASRNAKEALEAARAEGRREGMALDQPWPVPDMLARLADAADHLLTVHSCDRHGYEGVQHAIVAARAWLEARLAAPKGGSDHA